MCHTRIIYSLNGKRGTNDAAVKIKRSQGILFISKTNENIVQFQLWILSVI